MERNQAEWRISACDQKKNCNVIDAFQPENDRLRSMNQVIQAAGREHQQQCCTKDAEGHHMPDITVHGGLSDQYAKGYDSEQSASQVAEATDGVTENRVHVGHHTDKTIPYAMLDTEETSVQERAATRWWLYLIETRLGQLYCGITTDVERRLAEHSAGRGAKFLRGKSPLNLRFSLELADKSTALRAEIRVKRLTRREKDRLIRGDVAILRKIQAT